MKTISAPVGEGVKAVNRFEDVVTIQQLLNDIDPSSGGASPKLKVDGKCGPKTKEAIQKFQLRHFGWKLADGRVDPGGVTLNRMNECAGGPSSWAKSTQFTIRRQQGDSSPATSNYVDVYEVKDKKTLRRAFYVFTSGPDVQAPTGTLPSGGQFQGAWTLLQSTSPLAVFELQGQATLITTASPYAGTKLYKTVLTITRPPALITGIMHFVTLAPKHGYFKFWAALD